MQTVAPSQVQPSIVNRPAVQPSSTFTPSSASNPTPNVAQQEQPASQESLPMSIDSNDPDSALLKNIHPVFLPSEDQDTDLTILQQTIAGKTNLETWNQLLLESGEADLEGDLQHEFFLAGMNKFIEGAKAMAEGMTLMRQAAQSSTIPDLTKMMVPVMQKVLVQLGVKKQGRPTNEQKEAMNILNTKIYKDKAKGDVNPTERTEVEKAKDDLIAAQEKYFKATGFDPRASKKRKQTDDQEEDQEDQQGSSGMTIKSETVSEEPRPKKVLKNNITHYKCPVCGFVKRSYGAVESHINKDHLNRMLQCVYCQKMSYSKDSIKSHQRACSERAKLTKVEQFEDEVTDDEDPRGEPQQQDHEPENLMQEIEQMQASNQARQDELNRQDDLLANPSDKELTVVFDFEK